MVIEQKLHWKFTILVNQYIIHLCKWQFSIATTVALSENLRGKPWRPQNPLVSTPFSDIPSGDWKIGERNRAIQHMNITPIISWSPVILFLFDIQMLQDSDVF